jgi:thymidylate synthase
MLKLLTLNNKKRDSIIHDENQYLKLIDDILEYGELIEGRNGNTKMVYGSAMHFSLEDNKLPLLTTKKVAWKTCLKELLWFISGNTDNKVLQKQGVKIWNGNGSREFLDSRKLYNLEENDLGPVYGHQWRFFNAEYTTCNDDYTGKGVDQLQQVIDMLNDPIERYSRRIVMSAWNPNQLNDMALPPCHVLIQFNVSKDNKLSASLYQRSGDVGLGVPFNIASYSFLIHLLAHHCNLEAYEFIYYLGNTHIYDDHLEVLKEQSIRIPYKFPIIELLNRYDNINDYKIEDFKIYNYKSHETIKMVMRK